MSDITINVYNNIVVGDYFTDNCKSTILHQVHELTCDLLSQSQLNGVKYCLETFMSYKFIYRQELKKVYDDTILTPVGLKPKVYDFCELLVKTNNHGFIFTANLLTLYYKIHNYKIKLNPLSKQLMDGITPKIKALIKTL